MEELVGSIIKKIVTVILILLMILVVWLDIYMHKHNNSNNGSVVNEKEVIDDSNFSNERKAAIENGIDISLIKKIESMGFVENNNTEKYRPGNLCFTKDEYTAVLEYYGRNLYLYKDISFENYKNYYFEDDLKLIEQFFDKKIAEYASDNIHKIAELIANNAKENDYISLEYVVNDMDIYVRYYNEEIEFRCSKYSIGDTIFNPTELQLNMKDNKDTKTLKEIYNLLMTHNKNKYKFYDYIYNYYDSNNKNLCNVKYNSNNYSFETDICHGGTSNASFLFKHYTKNSNEDRVSVKFDSDYFEKNLVSLIKNDIKYFNEKLFTSYNLTSSGEKEVLSVISKKDSGFTDIYVDDNFKISIYKSVGDNNYRSYTLTYVFN